jgi:hypothetical protein
LKVASPWLSSLHCDASHQSGFTDWVPPKLHSGPESPAGSLIPDPSWDRCPAPPVLRLIQRLGLAPLAGGLANPAFAV